MILAPPRDTIDLAAPSDPARFQLHRSLNRRLAFLVPAIGFPVLGTWLAAILTAEAHSPLRVALLVLLFGNLLYVALTGWPGVLGALARLFGRTRVAAAAPNGTSRTAVLFPIYNEDPRAVFAAVQVMARALIEQRVERTDIFVLSDTRDAAIAADEQAAFDRVRTLSGDRVHYRRQRR